MACFLVPATEAVITTVVEMVVKAKEKKEGVTAESSSAVEKKIRFSTKLGWLNKLLWGGSALLAFEHIWHGEVIPTFPFLTAVREGDTAGMLGEMGSVGVCMAILVTLAWGGMLIVSAVLEKRQSKEVTDEQTA